MSLTPGLLVGVVEDTNDPEGLGRVKVLIEGVVAESLGWLPMRTFGAGAEAGLYTPPQPGDQVALARLRGAAAAYVVLGGVWSAAMTPPETNEGEDNVFRGFRSRSAQRLTFDDSGKAKLVFVTAGGTGAFGMGAFAKDGSGDNAVELPRNNLVGDKGVALAGKEAVELRAPDGKISIKAKEITVWAMQKHTASGKSAAVEATQTKLAAMGALMLGGSTVGSK
ncbi:MAG: hypothetical protein IPL79_07925 [Myxococcales bacterium]|nr:hypothetical protein [Myxococcales bacterium]